MDMATERPRPDGPRGGDARLAELLAAAAFLTRVPLPLGGKEPARPLGDTVWAFAAVGLGVGGFGAAALIAASWLGLHPLASALIAVAAMVLVTGALHEDGLADVADGFGGGATIEAKLAIMRDSRIGAYGVLALIFSVAVRATAVAGMAGPGSAALALIVCAAASRAAVGAAMAWMTPARPDGLAAAAGQASPERAMAGVALAALAAFLLLGGAAWGALGGAAAGGFVMGWIGKRQIGGHSGDVLGAIQQTAETGALIGAAWVMG